MTAAPSPRHRSREAALQVLFAIDLAQRDKPADQAGEDAFALVADHFELPEGARAFAKELVTGVQAARVALDRVIAGHSRNWRVERMSAVDRNVLRLGIHELETGETPVAVVIDQAIELARRFGSDASPGFVNGILDAVARGRVRSSGSS